MGACLSSSRYVGDSRHKGVAGREESYLNDGHVPRSSPCWEQVGCKDGNDLESHRNDGPIPVSLLTKNRKTAKAGILWNSNVIMHTSQRPLSVGYGEEVVAGLG